MTGMEAESALARAVATYKNEFPGVPIAKFVGELMTVKTEVIKRSDVLEIMPAGKMSDVGGLGALKAWTIERANAFS